MSLKATVTHETEDRYWSGAVQLADLLRPVEDLVLLPGNPRQGDVPAIAQSLERFGQLKPIVVDDDGVILAGNHTYRAAVSLDWTHVAAVTAKQLEGSEKTAFALADNRLSDLATYDDEALLAMLEEVGDDRLEGTGFDPEDARRLAEDLASPEDFEEIEPAKLSFIHTCPRCGFEFDDG